MVFSSLLFLFRFLPAAFLAYYLTPKKCKNLTLLIVSLIFYSWGEVRYFPIMLSIILVNYLAGLGIGRWRGHRKLCRGILAVSVVFSVGFLAFFKYSNFLLMNLNALFGTSFPMLEVTKNLPLGISFYTFQIMTYTIDVYFHKIEVERNIIDFGTFVVLFPQLIAGPIVKYSDINRELKDRQITLDAIQDGIALFIFGLGSKVLLANNIGALWTEVESAGFTNLSTAGAWLALSAYALQIYFDFSGYSLMAIGMGRALGFHFPQNFNYPYVSRSLTEFWRRWHMTLGGWFREYLYFPLGGNRVSRWKQYRNLFLIWFATGLWHGAAWNFVLWGLYFFVMLSFERLFLQRFLDRYRLFSHLYVLIGLQISWVLFAITDMNKTGTFFSLLFLPHSGNDWMYYLRNYGIIMAVGVVFSLPVLNLLRDRLPKLCKWLAVPFLGLILLLSVAYLVDSTYNPFLYFRF